MQVNRNPWERTKTVRGERGEETGGLESPVDCKKISEPPSHLSRKGGGRGFWGFWSKGGVLHTSLLLSSSIPPPQVLLLREREKEREGCARKRRSWGALVLERAREGGVGWGGLARDDHIRPLPVLGAGGQLLAQGLLWGPCRQEGNSELRASREKDGEQPPASRGLPEHAAREARRLFAQTSAFYVKGPSEAGLPLDPQTAAWTRNHWLTRDNTDFPGWQRYRHKSRFYSCC